MNSVNFKALSEYAEFLRSLEPACLTKAIEVAADNRLVIQPKSAPGDYGLNDLQGERDGAAYYSEGTCHIYIF